MQIIPSLPTDNADELLNAIGRAEKAEVERFSVDIIDGTFADNKTVDPSVLNNLTTKVELDFQLMVKDPIKWVEKSVTAGGDRIIGHVEMMSDQEDFIEKVLDESANPGLGLDVETPVSELGEFVIPQVSVILLMSVPAGFGGQKFDESVIDKVKKLNIIRKREGYKFRIHVDGGVKPEHIKKLASAGCDEVSIGRRLLDGDIKTNISEFLNG